MKVPSFKSKKIREDIFEVVEQAPTRKMYDAVMRSIDGAMERLAFIREGIPQGANVKDMLAKWDKAFSAFGEREAYYYQAIVEEGDRSVVDEPLFEADYSSFEFSKNPKWPDIETPWRLANDLSTAAIVAGADQVFLDNLEAQFKDVISSFWADANELINVQKQEAEMLAAQGGDGLDVDEDWKADGRVYSFIPIIIVGAAALAAGLGIAAGYTAAHKTDPGEYVESKSLDKHLKTAKTVGVGVAIGVVLALLFMLRIRK